MFDIQRAKAAFRERYDLGDDAPVGWVGGWLGGSADDIATKSENGAMQVMGTISANSVDLDKEVVLQDGIDFSMVKSLFMDHEYGSGSVVGVKRYIKPVYEGEELKSHYGKFHIYESSVHAALVKEMAANKALGFSIGFMRLNAGKLTAEEKSRWPKAERITRKSKAFEVSCTPMPCNVDSWADTITYDDSKAATIRDLVTKGRLPKSCLREAIVPRKTIIIL